jgi:hypothetical protein
VHLAVRVVAEDVDDAGEHRLLVVAGHDDRAGSDHGRICGLVEEGPDIACLIDLLYVAGDVDDRYVLPSVRPYDWSPRNVEDAMLPGRVDSVMSVALAAGSEPETRPDDRGARASRFFGSNLLHVADRGRDPISPVASLGPAPGDRIR